MKKKSANNMFTALRNVLLTETLHTQAELEQVLQKLGYEVNQSKISRALHKLGAVKIKNTAGAIVYQLPTTPLLPAPTDLAEFITLIEHNEILIVIHTSPGSAALIARLLDHQQKSLNIMGTVAGDDTILIIPKTIKAIKKTVTIIRQFLGILS